MASEVVNYYPLMGGLFLVNPGAVMGPSKIILLPDVVNMLALIIKPRLILVRMVHNAKPVKSNVRSNPEQD